MRFAEKAVLNGRLLLMFVAVTASGALVSFDAVAEDRACAGVDTRVTDARKHEFSALIASAIEAKEKPLRVTFQSFMTSGAWTAVYAQTPETEWGVFFFETVGSQKRYKDVWGGFAVPEDRPELVKWAKALGVPENLATCFAHVVTDRN